MDSKIIELNKKAHEIKNVRFRFDFAIKKNSKC